MPTKLGKKDRRKEAAPVSANKHMRSWVAGVIDNGCRVHIIRRDDPASASLQLVIKCMTKSMAEEVQNVLQCGRICRDGRAFAVRCKPKEVFDNLQSISTLLSGFGPARDYIRIVCSWATTVNLREGFGKALPQDVINHRIRFLRELDLVRVRNTEGLTDEPNGKAEDRSTDKTTSGGKIQDVHGDD